MIGGVTEGCTDASLQRHVSAFLFLFCIIFIHDYSVWELAAIGRVLSSLSADFPSHDLSFLLLFS